MKMVENITQAILSPSSEPRWPCPGSSRDRCQHCGGWISLGHAREIILELEHELNDAKCVIADQAIALTKNSSRRRGAKLLLAAIAAFLIGWVIDPPAPIHRLIYGDKAIATELSYRFPHACTFTCSIPPKTDARDI